MSIKMWSVSKKPSLVVWSFFSERKPNVTFWSGLEWKKKTLPKLVWIFSVAAISGLWRWANRHQVCKQTQGLYIFSKEICFFVSFALNSSKITHLFFLTCFKFSSRRNNFFSRLFMDFFFCQNFSFPWQRFIKILNKYFLPLSGNHW